MPDSAKISPLVWGVILAATAVAVSTWRFGSIFLLQFFISPFQFFSLPLWLIALYAVRTGKMPVRSGPPVRRDESPKLFWQNVRTCIWFGAAGFVFNLVVSWSVLSR